MKLITSVAVSAAGAWLAGTATAVVGLSAMQSRLPAMMTRWLAPEPDLERALVLLGTGESDPHSSRAETMRAALEEQHGRPVLYLDLTVRPGTSARQAAQARQLAREFQADYTLDHDALSLAVDGIADEDGIRGGRADALGDRPVDPASDPATPRRRTFRPRATAHAGLDEPARPDPRSTETYVR